jgi:hypothetical protein
MTIITNHREIPVSSYWSLTNKEQQEIRNQFYCNTEDDFEDWEFFKVCGNWYELSEALPHADKEMLENWEGMVEMRDGGFIYIKGGEDGDTVYNPKIVVGIDFQIHKQP